MKDPSLPMRWLRVSVMPRTIRFAIRRTAVRWLTCACLMLCQMPPGLGASETASRPNVLFLFTDDQRSDTVSALGNDAIRTPNMDRLVREGLAFRNAYIMGGSSPAVCSPSRACLMSGRTLWNIECQGEWGFEISAKYKTLPEVFRENGYVTFGTGKNEPGRAGAFGRSFSTGDKILFRGMTKSQYKLPLCAFSPDGKYPMDAEVMETGSHSAEVYADACIRFLETRSGSDQPFFAYVAFQTPHDPRQCPPEYRAMYRDEDIKLPKTFMPQHPFDNGMPDIRDEKLAPFPRTPAAVRKQLADYHAVITHTDAQIGRILDALEKTGKKDNTIIVFSSDNGLAVGCHGLMGKQNVYDHSVHVPLILAGPGIPRGETRDQLCYIYDIYPTLCGRAGLKTPDTVQFKSLDGAFRNPAAPHRDHLSFAFMSWQRAVRDSRHKLIEYCVGNERHTQLFDLLEDPGETTNLAADAGQSATLAKLRKLLEDERLRLNDGNTPFAFSNQQGVDFWKAYHSGGKPLPRVLLIGDSICGGYWKNVQRLLAGKAEVVKNQGNAEYTGTGLKKIDEWLGDGKWDVIHFNWGLWDMYGWEYAAEERSPGMYGKRLEHLVERLEKTGAKLIWATTTPPCPGPEVSMLKRFNTKLVITPEVERQYRDAALRVMRKHHVRIDDLHALVLPDLEKYSPEPDDVHFTDAGYGVLGKQVADSIMRALGTDPSN